MLKVFGQSVHCHIKNSYIVRCYSLSSIIFSLEMGMDEDKSLHTNF